MAALPFYQRHKFLHLHTCAMEEQKSLRDSIGEFPKSVLFLACTKIPVKQRDTSQKDNRNEHLDSPIMKEK